MVSGTKIVKAVLRMHDCLSQALFSLAGAALLAATGLFLFEVVSRYLLNNPSTWSNEFVEYCLAVMIFSALPEVTRRNMHIAVEVVPEHLPAFASFWLSKVVLIFSVVVCACAGWIMALEAIKQFGQGLMTNAAYPVPRYLLTGLLATGLIGAATHFFRQLFEKGPSE